MIDQIVANQGENRPNPNEAFPNPNIPSFCYIIELLTNDYRYNQHVFASAEYAV